MNLNKKKNVLYFCSSGVYGGAERFVEECMLQHKSYDDMNARVFFLNRGRFFERCIEKRYQTDFCPFQTRLKNIFSWIRFQFYFYSFLKKEKIDIVHLTMAYSQIFASVAARFAKVKVVWFQHGPIGGVIDRVANCLPYDNIIFNSQFTKSEHLLKAGKIRSRDDILFIQVTTSYDSDEVRRIHENYKDYDSILLATGRICRWKGYEEAIRAFEKLTNENDFNGVLFIIGEPATDDDKDYLNELKAMVGRIDCHKHILFLGFKANIYDYMKSADVLIHCSQIPEPFGLVVAESISLGTYVFVPPVGGVYEQLKLAPSCGSIYKSTDHLCELLGFRLLKRDTYKENINLSVKIESVPSDIVSIIDVLRNIYYS